MIGVIPQFEAPILANERNSGILNFMGVLACCKGDSLGSLVCCNI